jgi:diketogulonate reductase-like aldo/keto reductase
MDIATIPLPRSGARIPSFGLGTFRSEGKACYESCLAALRAGYRLIDTAALYCNEDQVGCAIGEFLAEQTAVTRSDLFIVTKLHWDQHGGDTAAQRVDEALTRLKLDYVDLFLIHSPKGKRVVETYKALQAVKAAGKIRALGVSNFGVQQLQALMAVEGVEAPAVHQIELHLWLHQTDVTSFCKLNDIVVMAYCPLARCQQFGKTPLAELAAKLQTTEAALCNYWVMKNGFVTIPKSSSPGRVEENLAAAVQLKLSAADSLRLEQLNLNFVCSLAQASQNLAWESVA